MLMRDFSADQKFASHFSRQFRRTDCGDLIRILRDQNPHPFIFLVVSSMYKLLLYLVLIKVDMDCLLRDSVRSVEEKGLRHADHIAPGSHAGILIHFAPPGPDEIWYLPGVAYLSYWAKNPLQDRIPLDYIRCHGVQLSATPTSHSNSSYDITAFLQAIHDMGEQRNE